MKGEEGDINSGRADARGRRGHRWAMGNTKRRQSDTGKWGEDGEREEAATEGREGKVGAERFKLTQNSTVKDKSRGKIQLKGTSPAFHHGGETTAFHTRVERGLHGLSEASQQP